ncbi:MAG TPA: DNA transposition protein [Porphyromonadaceae bacterium]|nr:DNA transposition protein [Porphyromonadaceae bacterium]
MIISEEKKTEIRDMLEKYCERYSSRNSAAQSLKNVSSSTISSVLNGKWENISDIMWKSIRTQVSPSNRDWEIVETPTFKDVTFVLKNAQEERSMTWLVAPAGSGKSTAAEVYRQQNKNVIYVLCDEDMKKSDLANEMGRAAGLRINTQRRSREKIMMVIDAIAEMDNPLIIFDEGDKLVDNILYYFITIYNHLRGKAGIVFLSTSYMQRRMEHGLRYDRKGFQELQSRIGRKFYEAERTSANDVYTICMANGITDQKAIDIVIKDASQCDFDLRRVDTKVRAMRKKLQLNG